MTTRTNGRSAIAGSLVLAIALSVPVLPAGATEPDPTDAGVVSKGRFLYRLYCMDCHGETGKGDGATASSLDASPADLTRLSQGNDGDFPVGKVYQAIDGRTEGCREPGSKMPIWGLMLQEMDSDVDQEQQVRERVLQIVLYLESIQKEA
jgi:mono/diheme cytochrome c family protein